MMQSLTSHLHLFRVCPFANKLLFRSFTTETKKNIKIAIIGSGPAGFYTAQHLLKDASISVDIYEKFPVPFGLVRFGVAPDHPEVKNVINSFTNTALNERVSFIGNVGIGTDITLSELREAYNAVVLCYGAAQDKFLNIEGEKLPNVISAKSFVGWYNGVPMDKELQVNLSGDTAVIIGHGNVALDCARILLEPVDDVLKNTDITNHSLNALRKSAIKRVYIIGRRGPIQAAFTIKEFREMTKIKDCDLHLDEKDFQSINDHTLESLSRPRRRLTELLIKMCQNSNSNSNHQNRKCFIKFNRSPLAIKGDSKTGIEKLILAINRLEGDINSNSAKAVETDEREELKCGLILRSIGYKSISIDPSLPFDKSTGTVKNEKGKVSLGLYCSGWIGTGATGVILNTMNDSFEVAKRIMNDIKCGEIDCSHKLGSQTTLKKLNQSGVEVVHFQDWKKIDKLEQEMGIKYGKPREKVVDLKQMIEAAKKVE